MRRKFWIIGGIVAAGLAACIVPWPAHPGTGTAIATLTLPDLDGDHLDEHLRIETDGQDRLAVRLDATAGHFTHEVLVLDHVDWPLHVSGSYPRWRAEDALGRTAVDVRMVAEAGRDSQDLVVLAGGGGKRYRWVEKGFLKLDANTVIPGFSVGLVMLGDAPQTLGMLGDRPTTSGAYSPAAPPGVRFELSPEPTGRLGTIRFDSPNLVSTSGVAPGATLAALEKRLPGRREGDHWIAPIYGVTARLDAAGRALDFSVTQPWRDPLDAKPKRKGG